MVFFFKWDLLIIIFVSNFLTEDLLYWNTADYKKTFDFCSGRKNIRRHYSCKFNNGLFSFKDLYRDYFKYPAGVFVL